METLLFRIVMGMEQLDVGDSFVCCGTQLTLRDVCFGHAYSAADTETYECFLEETMR